MISIIFSAWVLVMTSLVCGMFLALMQPQGSPFVPYALVAAAVVLGLAVALPDVLSYPRWLLGLLWLGFVLLLYWLPLPHREDGWSDLADGSVIYQEDVPDIAQYFDFEEVN